MVVGPRSERAEGGANEGLFIGRPPFCGCRNKKKEGWLVGLKWALTRSHHGGGMGGGGASWVLLAGWNAASLPHKEEEERRWEIRSV